MRQRGNQLKGLTGKTAWEQQTKWCYLGPYWVHFPRSFGTKCSHMFVKWFLLRRRYKNFTFYYCFISFKSHWICTRANMPEMETEIYQQASLCMSSLSHKYINKLLKQFINEPWTLTVSINLSWPGWGAAPRSAACCFTHAVDGRGTRPHSGALQRLLLLWSCQHPLCLNALSLIPAPSHCLWIWVLLLIMTLTCIKNTLIEEPYLRYAHI